MKQAVEMKISANLVIAVVINNFSTQLHCINTDLNDGPIRRGAVQLNQAQLQVPKGHLRLLLYRFWKGLAITVLLRS
jgi:hypothetical protein